MKIKDNILTILKELPSTTKLVAVSKFISDDLILEAYDTGIRDFAENRPQELSAKMERLPADIRWHFIGRLQTNKIKMIINRVHLIHSVDSIKLLSEISKEASKKGIFPSILLQQHISGEESKQGFTFDEMFEASKFAIERGNVKVCGVMGMASFTDDLVKIRSEFATLKGTFDSLKRDIFSDTNYFSEISMGMSGDYRVAVEEGSTIVRVGTGIFGSRL